MPFCAHCGKPYEGSPKFCPFCGRPVSQAQAPSAYAPTVPVAVPARKRNLKWLWIGLAALIVVVAVVLVLVLVVFGGENGGGKGEMTAPEKAVAQFFDALETKDIDRMFNMIDPKAFGMLPEGMDLKVFKDMLRAAFPYKEMKFKDIKMSTQMTSDTTATVTIVEGSVSLTFPDGHTETEDVSEAGEPVTIDLVKVDGKWFLESTPFME
jgi:uncharacterized membrane protein YvbJ